MLDARGVLGEAADELLEPVSSFAAHRSPEHEVRRLIDADAGYDSAVWQQLCSELELAGLAIPSEFGGSGYGAREVAVVMEQFGRRLLPSPYLASAVLAAGALLASEDEAAMNDLLPGIANGHTIATLAVTESEGDWDVARGATTAVPAEGGAYRVTGEKAYVLDGANSDLLIVSAMAPEGPTLLAVDAKDARILPVPSIDLTRRLSTVTFSNAPATLVGGAGDAAAMVRTALARAAIALASSQAGGALECVAFTTAYARDRYQYGRPIGSFQAIKHRLADMLRAAEYARAAAYEAARIADDDPSDLVRAAAVARTFCSDAYIAVTAGAIQVHGGIGFTWEHAAHLYFRRARLDAVLLGDARCWREQLADHLLSANQSNGALR